MLSKLSPSSRKRRRVQQQLRQNRPHRQVEPDSVVQIDSSDSDDILPNSSGNLENEEMPPQPEEVSHDVHPQLEDPDQPDQGPQHDVAIMCGM